MLIMQYDREFRKLARFAPSLVTKKKDRMKRFLNGLKPIMQKDLSISNFSTNAELLNKALKLKRGYNQLHAYQNQGDKKRVYYQESREELSSRIKHDSNERNLRQRQEVKCQRCGRDHLLKDCLIEKGVCFHCKKIGHIVAYCPEKEGVCPRCGRHHELTDCLVAKGICFHCKRRGHISANCPEKI